MGLEVYLLQPDDIRRQINTNNDEYIFFNFNTPILNYIKIMIADFYCIYKISLLL